MNNNLNDKINLLYDYIYNNNTKNCFSINKIKLDKIRLDDIKLLIPDTSVIEDVEYYEINKEEILNSKFKLLSFDENTNNIYLKKYSNQFPITIKISFYNFNENIDNLYKSPINNDSLFSYILSELILNRKTKHLSLPLMNIDIKVSEIYKIISDDNYINKIKKLINNNIIQDTCCLQLKEHFFKSINLFNYLLENKCIFKGLIFQVIHTIAVLQKEFPGFKHNNLILKNIFLYLKKPQDNYTEYEGFKNDKFYLPNLNFDIKINNFEKSIIPKFYEIQKSELNYYYDIYTFLNDLISFKTINDCDKSTETFFNKYLPINIRNNSNNNINLFKPTDLLYDNYFDEYKKLQITIGKDTISNHIYLTNKYNIIESFMNSDNYSTLGNQNKIKSNMFIMNKRIIKNDKKLSKKINRINFQNSHVLVGGFDKQPFKNQKNTPFISNEEKSILKKKREENPIREPAVLLEQKIYDTSNKLDKKNDFPPPYIPLYDQKTGDITAQMLPYSNILGQPPVQQKMYNITLSNPLGNPTVINRIYEDMLPGEPKIYSGLTIYERLQLCNFIRNTMIDLKDGENMDISGGKNSLLSFIKVMDCNPYTIKNNPYHDLSRDFLLYRAAYPIRYNEKSNIEIAKQSMGMNVRMYKMSIGAIKAKSIGTNIDSDSFDLWREVKYYTWVKDYIIKNKISPNFISSYLYKIDTNSRIDWDKLDLIKKKVQLDSVKDNLIYNQQKINKLHSIKKTLGQLSLILPKEKQESRTKLEFNQKIINIDESYINKINIINNKFIGTERQQKIKIIEEQYKKDKEQIKELYKEIKGIDEKDDLTLNSGKVLLLLTEAPTSGFLQWSGPIYEKFGTIRKMISTGHHTPEVWKSIIFQLLFACAVLEKSQILIENFSLENNVFIKDIFTDYNSIGSWIYKINGINYYIPNYGYILMIDSKYSDINTEQEFNKSIIDEQKFKIYSSKIFSNNSNIKDSEIKDKIIQQFKNILNPDNYRHKLNVDGGGKIDDSIIDLLSKIHNNIKNEDGNNNISSLLPEFFGNFVHNRVGTLLYRTEIENINILSRPNFNKGNLLVYQKRYQEYIWVIYVESIDRFRQKIITKNDNTYSSIIVFSGSLFGYPENEKIIPEPRYNMKYDEYNIYETYNLDNIN